MSKRNTKGKVNETKGKASADGVAETPAVADAATAANVAGDAEEPAVQQADGGVGSDRGAAMDGADALVEQSDAASGEGQADPAGAQGEEVIDVTDPVEMLIFAHNSTPQALVAASYFAMDEALRLVCTIDGVEEPQRVDFLGLFEHQFMAGEAHDLISTHGNLPADSLWLHLTARELMPKTAESFAELPGWQRHGFKLFIAAYEALLPVVNAMIAERREALRAAAQAQAPTRHVPLSETIFERHGHVTDLVDGLRLNPRS